MGDKKIYLIGVGTGNYEGLTIQAANLIKTCDLLLGADRMLKAAEGYQGKMIHAYQPGEICRCLKSEENKEWKKACILLSGDVGFYSGTKKLLEALLEYSVELVSCSALIKNSRTT